MDSGSIIQIIIILLLILLSAFFSSAETALTTVNKIRIKALADEGNKRAATVLKIIDDSGKMLSAILIGNNIVNICASSLATTVSLKLFGNLGVSITTGLLTLVILIFAEITPKTIATIHSESISLAYANVVYVLIKVLTPLIAVINNISTGVLKLFRIKPNSENSQITESELRTIVEVSKDDGVIENSEYEMIHNVFEFGDSSAKDIMVPRIDMTFVNINNTFDEILEIYRQDMYTRYPVYEDTTDNVIGFINVKDLLLCDDPAEFNIKNILREPYFTYEHKNTSELLIEMRNSSINTAIVLDEYGATAGLITLEDLLEEIVGEIRDEYDDDEEEDIISVNDSVFLVDGNTKLDDINESLNIELTSEEYDSIAGFLLEAFDRLPVEGEEYNFNNEIIFTVEKMDKNRIEQVKIQIENNKNTAS